MEPDRLSILGKTNLSMPFLNQRTLFWWDSGVLLENGLKNYGCITEIRLYNVFFSRMCWPTYSLLSKHWLSHLFWTRPTKMSGNDEESVGDFSNTGLKKINLPLLKERKKPNTLIYDRNQISKIDGLEKCQNYVQNVSRTLVDKWSCLNVRHDMTQQNLAAVGRNTPKSRPPSKIIKFIPASFTG